VDARAPAGEGAAPTGTHQGDLLRDLDEPEIIALDDDCQLLHHRGFLAPSLADDLFSALVATTPWQQDHVQIAGRRVPLPRLQSWHADGADSGGGVYTYSGIELRPKPWTQALAALRAQVVGATRIPWNSVLANLYRNGADSVAWHRDDEPELGPQPPIASVSLGATRRFVLRDRWEHARRVALDLGHGSLLVMQGATQHRWDHSLPKTARRVGPRVNLTFRVLAADGLIQPL
jgi:alkylated DNA repair dioxygenase AlkB